MDYASGEKIRPTRKDKSKQKEVLFDYFEKNPKETNKTKISKELNISLKTVIKWYKIYNQK